MLSGQYRAGDASVDVRTMVESRGGRFIDDRVVAVAADRKCVTTEGGEELRYDVLSLNIGSEVGLPSVGDDVTGLFPVKPVSRLLDLRVALAGSGINRAVRLLVVGGGPAGCEAAANARALSVRHGHSVEIRLVTAAARLLPELPATAGERMAAWCREHGIGVETGRRVTAHREDGVVFEDGSRAEADFVVAATGVHPPGMLHGSCLATDAKGALLVDEHLQSVSHPGVFGGGDCISFRPRPLARVGVYAVRQAPVLFHNLLAAMVGDRMQTFTPQHRYLLILNLGDGTGLFVRGSWVASGRLACRLKQWLDRRFIRRYQRAVVGPERCGCRRPRGKGVQEEKD
jgi:NADH dehydrogenase FAD-containing subunit